MWLFADRASAHSNGQTHTLAAALNIGFVWLPKQAPELNVMGQLWRELKAAIAANRQAQAIDVLAIRAMLWVLLLGPSEAKRNPVCCRAISSSV